jgi:hypothetical protein
MNMIGAIILLACINPISAAVVIQTCNPSTGECQIIVIPDVE